MAAVRQRAYCSRRRVLINELILPDQSKTREVRMVVKGMAPQGNHARFFFRRCMVLSLPSFAARVRVKDSRRQVGGHPQCCIMHSWLNMNTEKEREPCSGDVESMMWNKKGKMNRLPFAVIMGLPKSVVRGESSWCAWMSNGCGLLGVCRASSRGCVNTHRTNSGSGRPLDHCRLLQKGWLSKQKGEVSGVALQTCEAAFSCWQPTSVGCLLPQIDETQGLKS